MNEQQQQEAELFAKRAGKGNEAFKNHSIVNTEQYYYINGYAQGQKELVAELVTKLNEIIDPLLEKDAEILLNLEDTGKYNMAMEIKYLIEKY